jgi:hypothetical protein
MSDDQETQREHVPAYVSFPTLENFIGIYSGATDIPRHIDRSLMRNLSGAVQNHLMASLKFLALIDNDGAVMPGFRVLAKMHGTDEFAAQLREEIDSAYQDIVNSAEISALTPKTLQEKFRDAGATGSTNAKAIRFYLQALKKCGLTVPRHLAAATAGATTPASRKKNGDSSTSSTQKSPQKSKQTSDSGDGGKREPKHHVDDHHSSFPVFLGPGREGQIVFPTDISADDCEKFAAAIAYLKALAR